MTPHQILVEARELISDEENWNQEFFALDEVGDVVEPHSDAAKCFCARGAVMSVVGADYKDSEEFYAALDALNNHTGHHSIIVYNDSHDHLEVLQVFNKAIADLETA